MVTCEHPGRGCERDAQREGEARALHLSTAPRHSV